MLLQLAGQIVFPAAEQVARELAQLPKFAVSAFGLFQLLRLYQKALLFECLFEFFALHRALGSPLAGIVSVELVTLLVGIRADQWRR